MTELESFNLMWKQIKIIILLIFIWILVLVFSLIFLNCQISTILGIWFLLTALIMQLTSKRYEKWYWKNYKNLHITRYDRNRITKGNRTK